MKADRKLRVLMGGDGKLSRPPGRVELIDERELERVATSPEGLREKKRVEERGVVDLRCLALDGEEKERRWSSNILKFDGAGAYR